MRVREGSHLGQVSDNNDLVPSCQLTQSSSDLDTDRASDALIDLVEDESLRNLGLGHDDL